MAKRDTSLQVKQILGTTVTDGGKILAQLGTVNDEGTAETDSDNADWMQQVGLASRPSQAQPGSTSPAAYAITVPGGDRDTCIASQDVRCLNIYGNLGPGETCLFAAGKDGKSQGRALVKDDGSVTLLTTDDNTPTGKVVTFKVAPTGMTFTAPWGSFTFDATGFHLKTKAGPRIDMGGMSLPGVPDALTSPLSAYCTITAPKINIKGGITNLGVGPSYATCLAAPSAALAPGSPLAGQPVLTGPTSQCATVRVSTP